MRVPVFVSLLAGLTVAQTPNLVVNGSFEQPPLAGGVVTFYAPSTAILGWQVFSGSVDQVAEVAAGAGSVSIDLDGLSPGGIRQTVATVAGRTYELSFLLAGNPGSGVKTLRVTADTIVQNFVFDATGTTSTNMGWTRQRVWFTAQVDGSVIEFLSTDASGSQGPAIDDVVVIDLERGFMGTYGDGCAGGNGTPDLLVNQLPVVGHPFSTLLVNLPSDQPGAAFFGFDVTGVPGLLRSLDSLGMPGCSLYSSADLIVPISSTSPYGIYVFGMTLPSDPTLAGVPFVLQFFFADPAANPLGVSSTGAAPGSFPYFRFT